MKQIFVLLVIAATYGGVMAQQPVKKSAAAKTKPPAKPVKQVATKIVKQMPPPPPKIITRAEILQTMVMEASKRCYTWHLFNDGYGYFASNYNTDGIDSFYVHPFADTATRFITDCIGLDGVVKYRLYAEADTSIKKIIRTYITNYGAYYKVGVNGPIVGEKELYNYKWFYTGNTLDSIMQYGEILSAPYSYVVVKDSLGLRLKKIQSNNRRLWFEAWLHPVHANIDSLQYYTYSSFTPYYPEKQSRSIYLYNADGSRLQQMTVLSDMRGSQYFYNYALHFFEYNTNGLIENKRVFSFKGADTGKAGQQVAIVRYEYNSKGLLATYTPLSGTSIKAPFALPADVVITTSTPRTFTNNYDGNGNLLFVSEFYEDGCVTDKSIYNCRLSPERYLAAKDKVPNIVTRCRY
jgi:hypothetical protein